MTWKLFLDDTRRVHDIYPDAKPGEFYHAWDFAGAWYAISKFECMPSFISFDHDLGLESDGVTLAKTGLDFAKSIIEMDLDGKILLPLDFSFVVHSANPCGANNIRWLVQNYLDFKNKP